MVAECPLQVFWLYSKAIGRVMWGVTICSIVGVLWGDRMLVLVGLCEGSGWLYWWGFVRGEDYFIWSPWWALDGCEDELQPCVEGLHRNHCLSDVSCAVCGCWHIPGINVPLRCADIVSTYAVSIYCKCFVNTPCADQDLWIIIVQITFQHIL